jgi:hypothetical protein
MIAIDMPNQNPRVTGKKIMDPAAQGRTEKGSTGWIIIHFQLEEMNFQVWWNVHHEGDGGL